MKLYTRLEEREEKVNCLATALKKYSERVACAKPWYARFLTWLIGFKTFFEKEYSKIEESINIELDFSDIELKMLNVNRNMINNSINQKEDTIKEYIATYTDLLLSLFYNKVLGASDLKIEKLEGSNHRFMAFSFLEDLEEFINQPLDPKEKEKVNQALEELFFALKVELATAAAFSAFEIYKYPPHEPLRRVANKIIDKLTTLSPAEEESGPSMVLLGGYGGNNSKEGHGTTYQIQKDKQGKFSFKVINTGDAANKFYVMHMITQKKVKESEVHELVELINNNKRNIYDWVLSDVNLNSPWFFIDLAHQKYAASCINSMSRLLVLINHNAKKSFKDLAKVFSGRGHKLQRKGNCSAKSISVWLHDRLGESLYRRFKVFMTEKELKLLAQLKEDFPDALKTVGDLDKVDQMKTQGKYALQTRKAKMNKIIALQELQKKQEKR